MQDAMKRREYLRQELVRKGGTFLERSGSFVVTSSHSVLSTVLGELSMCAWIQAFLALEGPVLPPDVRMVCDSLSRHWASFEESLKTSLRATETATMHRSAPLACCDMAIK
jgi:hypothetical protein